MKKLLLSVAASGVLLSSISAFAAPIPSSVAGVSTNNGGAIVQVMSKKKMMMMRKKKMMMKKKMM